VHRICFIDDDGDFEIPLFRDVFGSEYDIIAATGYDDARKQIDERPGWTPDLFVLDLYFPDGSPDTEAIATLKNKPLELPDDRAGIRTGYTNYLRAQLRLQDILAAHKQGPGGGLRLATMVARDFPETPIVFYSRKATFEDAVRCLATKGVRWVEKKPSGKTDAETRALTHDQKDRIVRNFNRAIAGQGVSSQSEIPVQDAARVTLEAVKSLFDAERKNEC
jgi:CheY-like chemotaxis protein